MKATELGLTQGPLILKLVLSRPLYFQKTVQRDCNIRTPGSFKNRFPELEEGLVGAQISEFSHRHPDGPEAPPR
jgi:hypothetical protein